MKEQVFDLKRTKENFMEAKKSFSNASTSGRKDRPELQMDPSMLTIFLEACMNLMRDNKAIKGLQEPINRCDGTKPGEPRVVWNLRKHTTRMGRDMRLTTQIGEYEMDQVILDLRLDVNVLPKQTWECMGRLMMQWSHIQLWIVNQ